MRKLQSLRKFAGTVFACLAFFVAQKAATQVCFIFYQDEIPEKVREIKKCRVQNTVKKWTTHLMREEVRFYQGKNDMTVNTNAENVFNQQ